MKRRTLIASGATTVVGGGVIGTTLGVGPMSSNESESPEYEADSRIVYERDDLKLSTTPDVVKQGEQITFEIQHTGGGDTISIGCNITWAIQGYSNGDWDHIVWTGSRYFALCQTGLQPGESTTETVELSISSMKDKPEISDITIDEFSPGKYRFVLLGEKPFLAVNFDIVASN